MRAGDAAVDLPSRIDAVVAPGQRVLVPTGFAVAVPSGWCGLVLSRSGLVLNHGVVVLNAPGLIDSGYRGELQVVLHNTGSEPFEIERGRRVAQFLVTEAPPVQYREVDRLPPAPDDRGVQGFGSSG